MAPEAESGDAGARPETQCSCCGDCCETLALPPGHWDEMLAWAEMPRPVEGEPDLWWGGVEPKEGETQFEAVVRTWQEMAYQAHFVRRRWTVLEVRPDGVTLLSCAAWDPGTRLCTAHGARPYTCSGYPWFGHPPGTNWPVVLDGSDAGSRCEFWADVPSEHRPEGWEPVLLTTRPVP